MFKKKIKQIINKKNKIIILGMEISQKKQYNNMKG